MAKKQRAKRPFPDIFPPGHRPGEEIDLSARFCYFYDLYECAKLKGADIMVIRKDDRNRFINVKDLRRHKQQLYKSAQEQLNEAIHSSIMINPKQEQIETVRNAINFLKQVAENERRKEVNIIKQYKNELINDLPKVLKSNQNINDILQRLEDFANNPKNGNMKTFYSDLTICITTIRKSAQEIRDRILQISKNNRDTFQQLAADNMKFRFGSDLDGLIKNMIGIKTKRYTDSLADRIQNLIINHVSSLIDSGQVTSNNFIGVIVGMLADFGNYLQKNKLTLIQGSNDPLLHDFAQIDKQIIENAFQNYLATPTYFLTSLQNNSRHLLDIVEAANNILGIRQLGKKEEEYAERVTNLRNRSTKKDSSGYINQGANMLKQKGNKARNDIYETIKHMHFTQWNYKGGDSVKQGQHGNLYELFEEAIKASLKVRGHAATDILSVNLGKLTGDVDINKFEKDIFDKLVPLKEAIENFEKKEREDAIDSLKKDFIKMNEDIESKVKELDTILEGKSIDEKKVFIYHESLKFYVRIEEHKTSGFEGRDLEFISALDRIYSMNGIAGLTLPDESLMYNIALNLSKNAVSAQEKNPVENYLSIFAGMLMFDDMVNMARELAQEAEKKIEYSHVDNIHLYLLNDIYVPSSMILSYIYEALEEGFKKHISTAYAARVSIDTSDADKEIEKYVQEDKYGSHYYQANPWEPGWKEERDKIDKGTKINIIFLTSFISFIQSLQEYFQ